MKTVSHGLLTQLLDKVEQGECEGVVQGSLDEAEGVVWGSSDGVEGVAQGSLDVADC